MTKYYNSHETEIVQWIKGNGYICVLFDFDSFLNENIEHQQKIFFFLSLKCVKKIAEFGKQAHLSEAVENIEIEYKDLCNINTNHTVMEKLFLYNNFEYIAKVEFQFYNEIFINVIICNNMNSVILSKTIMNFKYGYIDWILTAFKKIEIIDNYLTIHGSKEIDELPFKINLNEIE